MMTGMFPCYLSDFRYEHSNNKLLFDDSGIKMARKPGKKQKENPVG